jgi:tetratricopeptide (TPR) repeat protein
LIDLYAKICFDLKRFQEAEEKCRDLIARGYTADNWIRLGFILRETGRYREAVQAYQKGLSEIGLKEEDLNAPVFPISVPIDFDVFKAFIGLGESLLKTGNWADSARMFRRAAKLKANSPLPPLGFGRLFLETGEWKKAEEALLLAEKRNGMDAECLHTLGLLYEKKGDRERAYAFFRKAVEQEEEKPHAMESLFRTGSALHQWEGMRVFLEKKLIARPGSLMILETLARVYLQLENVPKVEELLARGLVLDERRPAFREIALQLHLKKKRFQEKENRSASIPPPSP